MNNKISRWDQTGIFLSTLCIIHCIAMPFISATLVVWGFREDHDMIHRVFFVLLAATGLLAFIPGIKRHGDKRVVALATIGMSIITFIAFFGHDLLSETWVAIINILGSASLISAHVLNHLLNRRNPCCHHDEDNTVSKLVSH